MLPGKDDENADELWGAELGWADYKLSGGGDKAISLFQNGIELVEYDICLGSQAFHISMEVIFVDKQFHMGVVEVFIRHCHEGASAYWLDGECELWNNQLRN